MVDNESPLKQKMEIDKRKLASRQTIQLPELDNAKVIHQNVIGNYLKSLAPHVQTKKLFKNEF